MEAKRSQILELFRAEKSPGEILKILQSKNVGRKLIYRTIQRYKETGSLKDRARSGRPRNVRTRELKAKLKKRIVRNPQRSMRKMSRDFGISSRSIGRVVHDDLGLKSLKRRKVHMLTKAIREKWLQRSRCLLSRAGQSVVNKIVFSDEKLFTIQEVSNPQNDRIISNSVQDIPE
ncbi:Transposase [Oopsacas minuta]|uniref:Transposase n=1 Tax=Oopsacas minuta TaxID=111878 RepID=A0AAV7KHL8_9METZ|nr:Transposase [Oopsacas minuta]